MAVMENCCCCRVRTACLIFGSLYLVCSLWAIGDDISSIITNNRKTSEEQESEYNDLHQAFNDIGLTTTREQIVNFINIDFYITFGNLFLSVFVAAFSALMLYGVHKAKSRFLVPSLIFYPIDTVVRVIFLVVHVANLGFLHPLSILLNVTCLGGIVFDFFIWLCVYSHRQQIKDQLVNHEEWEGNEKFSM
eukprot:TRINITY_DN8188_c0_g1_i1.p1 TRINITY_DN8188_c0_g1~~TRINITY_DN8188_c0_g1_i1.p1  ORF type:complete len:220 (-),score=75.87 TRINITY_DN8188_c0_g1_i1:179-751(-)